MAVSEIKPKFGTLTSLTITLASLASSTAGVGRQATAVDNSSDRWGEYTVYFKVKLGTGPSAGSVMFYLLRSPDGTNFDGNAGASDAGYTVQPGAKLVHVEDTELSPGTGDVIQGSFKLFNPGPHFALAVCHNTGVNLDSTGGNHYVKVIGCNPEAQLP